MRSLDDRLKVSTPESEWACRACPECDQRFLTDHGLRSHRKRYHSRDRGAEVSA